MFSSVSNNSFYDIPDRVFPHLTRLLWVYLVNHNTLLNEDTWEYIFFSSNFKSLDSYGQTNTWASELPISRIFYKTNILLFIIAACYTLIRLNMRNKGIMLLCKCRSKCVQMSKCVNASTSAYIKATDLKFYTFVGRSLFS